MLVLVLALALRRWKPAIGLAVAACALVLALRGQWFPDHAPARAGVAPLKVYFANIWNDNQDIPRAARSVAQAQPDVAAMVEFSDQHVAAQSVLFPTLPYRAMSPGNTFYNGAPRAIIAARWPVTVLTTGTTWNFNFLSARVAAPGGSFRLVVVHNTRPWPFRSPVEQAKQIARLEGVLADDPVAEPTLVLGDFNATASGAQLRGLMAATRMRSAPAVIGDWPSDLPGPLRIAIENAFSGPGLTILSRRIAAPTGSDHRPILLTVAPTAKR
jgi:endonuclease/exonuclease/phosphatase (EEP) superfamily protein YafD